MFIHSFVCSIHSIIIFLWRINKDIYKSWMIKSAWSDRLLMKRCVSNSVLKRFNTMSYYGLWKENYYLKSFTEEYLSGLNSTFLLYRFIFLIRYQNFVSIECWQCNFFLEPDHCLYYHISSLEKFQWNLVD